MSNKNEKQILILKVFKRLFENEITISFGYENIITILYSM